ncbi:hypothetical protein [Paraburkholderia heleia]|uniref:hypothetical protein n=1 Tax=Paraburkholderia heleia TaxID=634127 RepID=UPI0031D9D609
MDEATGFEVSASVCLRITTGALAGSGDDGTGDDAADCPYAVATFAAQSIARHVAQAMTFMDSLRD